MTFNTNFDTIHGDTVPRFIVTKLQLYGHHIFYRLKLSISQ